MDVDTKPQREITMPEDPDKIVQMPVRIDAGTRNELKIYAIQKGQTLNELLLKYIIEGFNQDKARSKK